VTAV